MVSEGTKGIQVQEAVLKYKYTEWIVPIVFLEDSTRGRKTLIAVAKTSV